MDTLATRRAAPGPGATRPAVGPHWWSLAIAVGGCVAVGGLGSLATRTSVETWYRTLERPAWTPPDWVFAPVWTTLYVLMGIAAWRIWRADRRQARVPLAFFGAQLAANLGWSFVFFGWRRPGLAFLEIIVLLALIGLTFTRFVQRDRLAGLLLAPYLVWVVFAAALNFAIWRLNPA